MGFVPPPVEICHFPSLAGNGTTFISNLPDSSDEYAIQRPSGETMPPNSCAADRRRGTGFRSLSRGSIQRSLFCPKIRLLPSGANENGNWASALCVRRSSTPLPSQAFLKMFGDFPFSDWYTTYLPSDDQTGMSLLPPANVSRERVSPHYMSEACQEAAASLRFDPSTRSKCSHTKGDPRVRPPGSPYSKKPGSRLLNPC